MDRNRYSIEIETTINNSWCDEFITAHDLATHMHRYLQNKFFDIVVYFIGFMAKNYENGRYDARNENACAISKIMFDSLAGNKSTICYKENFDRKYKENDYENN